MVGRLRLPEAGRTRWVAALVCYLVAVAVGAAVLTTLSGGLGGVLLAIGWALVLLVPLAVVATPPARDRPAGPQDHLPVLMRSKVNDPDGPS